MLMEYPLQNGNLRPSQTYNHCSAYLDACYPKLQKDPNPSLALNCVEILKPIPPIVEDTPNVCPGICERILVTRNLPSVE